MSTRRNLKNLLQSTVCVLSLATALPASADTLEEALAFTYVANPSLTAQRAYVKSVYEKIVQNRSGYRPVVSANGAAGYSHDDVDTDLPATTYETDSKPYSVNVSAVQPIFSGFSTVSSVKAAEKKYNSELMNLRATTQNILLDAVAAYTDVIRDKAVLELNENNEKVLERQLTYTQDKFRVGELTKTDVAQAQARHAGAVASVIDARGALKVSEAAYKKVIGAVPAEIYEPEIPTSVLPKSLEHALELALRDNPSLLAAKQSEESAAASIDTAKAGHYPTLDLVAAYENDHTDDVKQNSTSVMLVMNVPLYKGGNVVSRVRESKLLAQQARMNKNAVEKNVVSQTTQAWQNYESATASLTSLQERVKAAALAYEGVKYEEEAGERTILDVLNAQQELLESRVSVVSAKKEQIEASYRLLAATGKMTKKDLGLDVSKYEKSNRKKAKAENAGDPASSAENI